MKNSNTSEPAKLLLTPKQAADSLSISPRTLWTLANSGLIPTVRVGRSVRYDPIDLRRWIESRKNGGAGL